MPLFRQARSSNTERKKSIGAPNGIPTENLAHIDAPPTLPPPEANNTTATKSHTHSAAPSRKELLFHSQLAHGSSTKGVKDFSNVKELYQKIAEAFNLGPNEVREML